MNLGVTTMASRAFYPHQQALSLTCQMNKALLCLAVGRHRPLLLGGFGNHLRALSISISFAVSTMMANPTSLAVTILGIYFALKLDHIVHRPDILVLFVSEEDD
jgi:hypothetical protein